MAYLLRVNPIGLKFIGYSNHVGPAFFAQQVSRSTHSTLLTGRFLLLADTFALLLSKLVLSVQLFIQGVPQNVNKFGKEWLGFEVG